MVVTEQPPVQAPVAAPVTAAQVAAPADDAFDPEADPLDALPAVRMAMEQGGHISAASQAQPKAAPTAAQAQADGEPTSAQNPCRRHGGHARCAGGQGQHQPGW